MAIEDGKDIVEMTGDANRTNKSGGTEIGGWGGLAICHNFKLRGRTLREDSDGGLRGRNSREDFNHA